MNATMIIDSMNDGHINGRWHYSNFGFALLGYAIGVVSGKGYTAAMDEFLANGLGLQNSYTGTFKCRNLTGLRKGDTSGGNLEWGENLIRPAGDISSTEKELLQYAEINMNEELPYLTICHQKHAKHSFLFGKLLNIDIGLGWWVVKKGATDFARRRHSRVRFRIGSGQEE